MDKIIYSHAVFNEGNPSAESTRFKVVYLAVYFLSELFWAGQVSEIVNI